MKAQLYVPPLTLSLSPEYEGEGTGVAITPGCNINRERYVNPIFRRRPAICRLAGHERMRILTVSQVA
jgi:hypothetical protein